MVSAAAPTAVIGFASITVDAGATIPFDGLGSTSPSGLPLTYFWSFGDGATASGAEPMHAYAAAGTETVTLAVNDGFGGTSIATAKVIVSDVAPVFTPNTTRRRSTYTTSRRATGLASPSRRTTATSRSGLRSRTEQAPSTFTTASLPPMRRIQLTITASSSTRSPTPTPRLAMSLAHRWRWSATSWWSARRAARFPGRATAWHTCSTRMSRARPSASCWRRSTIPDPDALDDAHFGAAVGTTNTNIVIGAPGSDGGDGRGLRVRGRHDRRRISATCCLTSTNPDSTGRVPYFGEAVAGLGNNVIVGCAARSTSPAHAIGSVFCSTARRERRLVSIADPNPATDRVWLGGRGGRVEHPDRVAG